jgi:hypothetical protein
MSALLRAATCFTDPTFRPKISCFEAYGPAWLNVADLPL